jgi:glycosyltransferase involved in cell wall biosynthesis
MLESTATGDGSRNDRVALRIVLTNFRSPWDAQAGGGQTATDDLARTLQATGHRVRAVYAGSPPATAPSYPVRWVAFHERPALTALRVARGVARLLADEPADLVHSTGFEGAWLPASPPRVATLHQPDLPPWAPPSWSRPDRRLLYLRRHAPFALERRSLRRAARVVFTSAHIQRLAELRGYPVRRGAVVPNGVDVRRFSPSLSPPPAGGRPLVLFTGRFDDQKGIDVLLEAWRHLDGRAELRLAGAGWKESGYRNFASRLGLSSVVFQGHVPRERLPELLGQARLLVLPSRYENFPLSLLEAMSCAVPVVASRVGGIPELVADGETGLLVPPGDPAALAEAMGRLVDGPALARALGAAARSTIEARYSWDAVVSRLVDLYADVLSAEAGGR